MVWLVYLFAVLISDSCVSTTLVVAGNLRGTSGHLLSGVHRLLRCHRIRVLLDTRYASHEHCTKHSAFTHSVHVHRINSLFSKNTGQHVAKLHWLGVRPRTGGRPAQVLHFLILLVNLVISR